MRLLAAAFVLSGAAGLMYQVVWGRLLVLVFGSTTLAVSTVLSVFMGGLALGAWLVGRWIDRRPRPLIIYAALELGIGLYALFVPWGLDRVLPVYQAVWSGTSSVGWLLAARVVLITAILIVPTTLMGATLPVISRALASGVGEIAGRVGRFYALNTAGAVAGAWLTGFVLLPAFGVTPTIRVAVACNLAAAAAAWALDRRWAVAAPAGSLRSGESRSAAGSVDRCSRRVRLWVLATLALSGAAALIDEVAWSRALGLILGSSVYAFTAMLATFLIGLAGGAAVGVRLARRIAPRLAHLGAVQIGVAAAGLVTIVALSHLPFTLVRGADALGSLGAGAIPLLQFGLSFLVMFLPTVGFGLVFPLALHVVTREADDVGATVGRIYAVNTVGAIVGAGLAGFVLIPAIGLQGSLLLAIGVSLALGAGLVVADPSVSRRRAAGLALGLAVAGSLAVAMIPSWSATLMSSGMVWNLPRYVALYDAAGARGLTDALAAVRTVYQREGLTATVLVQRDGDGGRLLTINGRTESGDPFMRTQVLIAHWPLWLARSTERVLVIGLGSGATAGSVLRHPVRRLDVVELEAAILEASRWFEPENGRPLADPRTHASAADGRNFLLLSPDRYDVIISQPSLPWVAGAATLFTQDFFELAADRLAPGGVFGQWVAADALGSEPLRSVMAAFAAVFPHVLVVEPTPGDLFLIGSRERLAFDRSRIAAAFSDPAIVDDLRRVDVAGPGDLVATVVGDDATVRPLLTGAVPNRDENAYAEFAGPRAFAALLTGRRTDPLAWIPREQAPLAWNALLAGGVR
jgi:spermidine synthase